MWRRVRGEKYCASPTCTEPHARLVNRDFNGKRNIRGRCVALALGQPTPEAMRYGRHADGPRPPDFYVYPVAPVYNMGTRNAVDDSSLSSSRFPYPTRATGVPAWLTTAAAGYPHG